MCSAARTAHCVCRVKAMQAGLLQPDSTWYLLKLSSMSTILREWNALHSVSDLKFKQVLLSGSLSAASRRINPLQIPQVRAVSDTTLCLIARCISVHLLCCDLQGSAIGLMRCSTAESAILAVVSACNSSRRSCHQ